MRALQFKEFGPVSNLRLARAPGGPAGRPRAVTLRRSGPSGLLRSSTLTRAGSDRGDTWN